MSDFDAKISRELDLAEDVLRKALLRTETTGRAPNTVERTVGIAEDINALTDAINDLRRSFETKMDALIAAIPTATRIADDTNPKPARVKKKKTGTKKPAKKKLGKKKSK